MIVPRHCPLIAVLLFWALPFLATAEHTVIALWPEGAPGAVGEKPEDVPTLTVFLPAGAEGPTPAVVICPGGGYTNLSMDKEGYAIAEWLNERGVAGFVLKYRLSPRYTHPAPHDDGERAIRTVRAMAKEWNLRPDEVGMMGFSAGGHLTTHVGTQFDYGDPNAEDLIEHQSSRPDFLILGYPFVSFTSPETRKAARSYMGFRLIGRNRTPEQMLMMSGEEHVTAETPPTFIFHAEDDSTVLLEHSLLFHRALRKNKVPVELHTYQSGGHGFGLAPKDPPVAEWGEALEHWLKRRFPMIAVGD